MSSSTAEQRSWTAQVLSAALSVPAGVWVAGAAVAALAQVLPVAGSLFGLVAALVVTGAVAASFWAGHTRVGADGTGGPSWEPPLAVVVGGQVWARGADRRYTRSGRYSAGLTWAELTGGRPDVRVLIDADGHPRAL